MIRIVTIYLIFLFGILWHSLSATYSLVITITPWVLLVTYSIIIYPEIRCKNYSLILWLGSVAALTFLIELLGVKTGSVFGNYTYGNTLGAKAAGVPLVIGLNWGMIIWGCAVLADKLKAHVVFKILTASFAAVLLDIFIEPVAMALDYWTWKGGIIPLRNYAAWLLIALLFNSLYYLLKNRDINNLPVHFYLSQLIFFISLNIIMAG